MADVKVQSCSFQNSYWIGYDENNNSIYGYYTSYDIEPVLVFADGSKIAIEEYVETGFDSLTKTFRDLADASMDLIDGK